MIGIYRIWNVYTGKSYIGSSENIEQRLNQHRTNILNGILNGSELFKTDFEEYGKESFELEILKTLKTQKELESWENYFIGKYNSLENGYNAILSRRTPIVNVSQVRYEVKPEELLNKFELAVALKIGESKLNKMLSDENLPVFNFGSEKRYKLDDILNYYNSKEIEVL